jgi:hypothetical protein
MKTKIGNTWITTDDDNNVVEVHGTGLTAEHRRNIKPVECATEPVDWNHPGLLVDPFALIYDR